jgi:ATPase subunit of ABC transporter with duplicated ATPase domains
LRAHLVFSRARADTRDESELRVTSRTLDLHQVSFVYDGASMPIVERLSVQFSPGWTGIVGANGAGKTTLLRLACGLLNPTGGDVSSSRDAVYCPQRTDDAPDAFDVFIESNDPHACELRGRLKIDPAWTSRWHTLSHGERKRAQIGAALWRRPRVLALDEPTNHIDREARLLLEGALRTFHGVGLLVSHDRALLDALCGATLLVDPPGAVLRPGGYTKAMELAEAEQSAARDARQTAKRELARLQREADRRAREASMADAKRSKRHLGPGDSDGRAKIDLARVSGKDGQAGRLSRQLQGRLLRTQGRLDGIRVAKRHELSMELLGEPSRRNLLFALDAAGLSLGEARTLRIPSLTMRPHDRVAVVGPNGGGKSTLILHIMGRLDLPPERVLYLPQEIDRARGALILASARRLDHATLGQVMSVISCLGSRPQRLLETDDPSPGELRKILLAYGLSRAPNLIVMDEPTNHLDLPSIKLMEDALAGVRCALLLVSHDARFLARLTKTRWEIVEDHLIVRDVAASGS